MVTFPMTLTDLLHGFQGHSIFEAEKSNISKTVHLTDKFTTEH